jgi:Xaa-Pro dipeptidase
MTDDVPVIRSVAGPPSMVGIAYDPLPAAHPISLSRRRAGIEAKQDVVGAVLEQLGCEAAVLLMPAHVAWFTGGANVRGLLAETERPAVFTNGRQRWLACSNVDTHRLFDEELDGLGFQLKEWQWTCGRAALLSEITAGKRVAVDRPFPGQPLLTEQLRPHLRRLSAHDRERYLALGAVLAHALEATARAVAPGEPEQEVAGHLAHRLLRHGADAVGLSVTADDRGQKFRRVGFTPATVGGVCTLQASAGRDGLYATASRTVSFGRPPDAFRRDYAAAARVAAVYQSLSVPGETVTTAADAGRRVVGPEYEYEWRRSQPGYGAGWFPVEELRRLGADDPLAAGQPVVWQARVGAAAVVDTVMVASAGAWAVTPPDMTVWPYKRFTLNGRAFDVPDVLAREG